MLIYYLILSLFNQKSVEACSGQPPATTTMKPPETTTEYRPKKWPVMNEIKYEFQVNECPVYIQRCVYTEINMDILSGQSHIIITFFDGITIGLVRDKTLHYR